MSNPIYLDYHATTPVDLRVAKKVYDFMVYNYGNASSVDHIVGDNAQKAVKKAQQQIAQLINSSPQEIIFTSGATESINLVIQGHIYQQNKPSKIIISPVEHKAVIDTCKELAKRDLVEIIWLKIDQKARLDLNHLETVCSQGASLLCIMAANNEIGNIYPLEKIGKIAQKYQIPWLCDGSQAVGKIPIDFQHLGITFLTISGHKLYAPQGIGALVIKKRQHLQPIIYGGGHQNGLRSGTLNLPGIVGLGEACYLLSLEMEENDKKIAFLRNHLESLLKTKIPDLVVNGDQENKLAGNLHISVPGIPNSAIIARIRDKLAISTGSACSSEVFAPSHVLKAMNLPDELIESALRIGIGKFSTEIEIEKSAEILTNTVNNIWQMLH
jgi:cysteine desulfurase